jgi:hypothetical protein
VVIEICAKYPGGPTRKTGADMAPYIHTAATHLISVVLHTEVRGKGGPRRETAHRRIRMLLTDVCYGMHGTISVAGLLPYPTINTGGWNTRKGLGRR